MSHLYLVDAAKFGSKYLEKFGWDASAGQGLGVRGDGMTSHIKVAHKLDLMGIGANSAAKDGKDGIAWKQAREYEMLLMRLNQSGGGNAEGEGEGVEEEEAEACRVRDWAASVSKATAASTPPVETKLPSVHSTHVVLY